MSNNNNNMYNQQAQQQQAQPARYTLQKRVYKLMYTYANGNTEQVGFVNLDEDKIKTAEKFAGLEQRFDNGLNVGTIIFGEGFSVIAVDKGVIKNSVNEMAPLTAMPDTDSPF
jgi:hypothetical protein